jgi:CDP-diacylglycerol--glycerol-3-phosphate 3-phosphatidyltransferase
MTLADKITSLRLFLAPVFFVVYLFPVFLPFLPFAGGFLKWTVPVLWALFIASEITDFIDGKIARRRNEVSDFGKLFDPFADVLVRITYFLCFVVTDVLPVLLLVVVLYREFGILFLRILMMKKGIAMGARIGGKLKAIAYMLAGAVALLAVSFQRFGFDGKIYTWLHSAAVVIFTLSVLVSVISFADYLSVYRKAS